MDWFSSAHWQGRSPKHRPVVRDFDEPCPARLSLYSYAKSPLNATHAAHFGIASPQCTPVHWERPGPNETYNLECGGGRVAPASIEPAPARYRNAVPRWGRLAITRQSEFTRNGQRFRIIFPSLGSAPPPLREGAGPGAVRPHAPTSSDSKGTATKLSMRSPDGPPLCAR